MIWAAHEVIRSGSGVILDFGCWSVDERYAIRVIAETAGARFALEPRPQPRCAVALDRRQFTEDAIGRAAAAAQGGDGMTGIVGEVKIHCPTTDVFAYISDPSRRPEWQENVERIEVQQPSPGGLGTRVRETRRVSGRSMTATWEVTDYDIGHRYGIHGIDGPVRPVVMMTLLPVDDGTRVSTEIDFETHGVGKVFGILARRSARRDVHADLDHLRERLEEPHH
jgi:uncharacterized protein YndB with AHSA1/START domain